MVSVFTEDHGPPNEQLIEQLHRDLAIEDSPPDAKDPKSVNLRQAVFFCRQFWDKVLGPMARLHPEQRGMTDMHKNPINEIQLDEKIRQCSSPQKMADIVDDAIDGTIVSAVSMFHAHYQVFIARGGADSHPLLREYANMEKLLGERHDGSSLEKAINVKGMQFMVVLKSGMNTVRGMTMKLFGVIPDVSKVKYDRVLSYEELRQICRNTISLTRPLAKSHISVFDGIRISLMQGGDYDDPLEKRTELSVPLDPLHFHIVNRKGRLLLNLTPEFLTRVRDGLRERKNNHPDLFSEPRVGCPGNIIIPDVHRWIYSIAERFYFPAVDTLENSLS